MGHKLAQLDGHRETEFLVVRAQITLGLRRGYRSQKIYTLENIKAFILKLSQEDIGNGKLPLSFTLTMAELIYARENKIFTEPALLLSTLNNPLYSNGFYPPPLEEKNRFKERIIRMAKRLGEHFYQNRVYVEFSDSKLSITHEVSVPTRKAAKSSVK